MKAYDFKVLLEPDHEAGGYVVTCPALPAGECQRSHPSMSGRHDGPTPTYPRYVQDPDQ